MVFLEHFLIKLQWTFKKTVLKGRKDTFCVDVNLGNIGQNLSV